MTHYGGAVPLVLPTAQGPSESASPQEKINFYQKRILELSSQKDAHKQALSLLGQAESHLKGAMDDLSKAMTAAKVDVLGNFGPRRRGLGGGLLDRGAAVVQSSRLRAAKQHTAQATEAMQQAVRLSPNMPLTPEARLPGGPGGFMNFMFDGMMMDALMIQRLLHSKRQVETSLRHLAGAQQWQEAMVREISSSRDHAQATLKSIETALMVQAAAQPPVAVAAPPAGPAPTVIAPTRAAAAAPAVAPGRMALELLTAEQCAKWLEKLSVDAQPFLDHKVCGKDLLKLSDEELRDDLGVKVMHVKWVRSAVDAL
eukprot:jgi/Mesvir1/11716/Mv00100-RA.1